MSPFVGFPKTTSHSVAIPSQFFTELLPEIGSLEELKISLYVLWYLSHQEGPVQFITKQVFLEDNQFMNGLDKDFARAQQELENGLELATQRGFLLKVNTANHDEFETIYFLNSVRGRNAVESLEKGDWSPEEIHFAPIQLELEKPNIFRLYEDNIGPLTPIIADALRDAEKRYHITWIEEAIQIAVENNVRRWRYIEAILESWQKEGRNGTDRRDAEENRRRYLKGEYSEYIEH